MKQPGLLWFCLTPQASSRICKSRCAACRLVSHEYKPRCSLRSGLATRGLPSAASHITAGIAFEEQKKSVLGERFLIV
ncbi:hypothetical protein ASPFODRAFT_53652 [Aspergillus luchuensis CBS 106.47]|uniref:Uncharacterized protein n=1 Tax=Aspergillus luchuensis (strain CBS 106.47) TaxID=1137211 RepID=A0A1M3T0L2_ASPLC|nr:hypothetical protein ASPFODRAFT_53652 [Aspergillus luchuensis CBS 106.47]